MAFPILYQKMAEFMASLDDWMNEEVTVSTALHKEHDNNAPGTSKATSAAEFKADCAAAGVLEAGQLQTRDPQTLNDALCREMDITTAALIEVERICELQTAVLPLSVRNPIRDMNSPLNCVRDHRRIIPYLDKKEQTSISYSNIIKEKSEESERDLATCVCVPDGEVILGIDILHPTKQTKVQHILVLASQEISELREKIVCPNDYMWTEDLSDDPSAFEELVQEKPTNRSKSAFFFINNTFYNDMRDPEAIDVSQKIKSWAEEGNRLFYSPQLEMFETLPMANVTFETVKLRLGYPYLYSHHGNCEHLMIFRDMRLFNNRIDSPYIKDYPTLLYYNKPKREQCRVCETEDATWLTCDDTMAPESPCFFCHNCFVKLHYSVGKEKLCQFKAYRYQLPNVPTIV